MGGGPIRWKVMMIPVLSVRLMMHRIRTVSAVAPARSGLRVVRYLTALYEGSAAVEMVRDSEI